MYTVYVFFFSLLLRLFCYVFCNLIQSSSPRRTFRTKRTGSLCNFLKAVPRTASFLTILSTTCQKVKLYSLRE